MNFLSVLCDELITA